VDGFYFAEALRFIYVPQGKILGATYGAHVTVPFIYKRVNTPATTKTQFDLGDVQINPLQLMWHWKPADFAVGYGMFIPSGKFDPSSPLSRLTSPGKGFWSHMLIAGGGWRIDESENWTLSIAGHYEICQEQEGTHITPGDAFTIEAGIGRKLAPGLEAGIAGYYMQQVAPDTGPNASRENASAVGIGPEVSTFWRNYGLGLTLRYAYEVEARNRPQGHLGLLVVTKKF
jgi:hypothetical protein